MLTPHLRSQFVTKTLTGADGREYKVVFLVAVVNGEVKAQVISATPVVEAAPLCLPVASIKAPVNFAYIAPSTPAVSPFNTLFFFDSQPTRAPSA